MHKKVLILSGPTHEYLDPVRFIGNASSGLMGKAIAEESRRRGHEVYLISGPVPGAHLPDPEQCGTLINVVSAEEMMEASAGLFPDADAIVFAAAVADYAPAVRHHEKMAKQADELILRLRPTPDIAATLCARKRSGQFALGFALQTSDGEMNARRKLLAKNLDGIVLNTPASLGASSGTFSYLGRNAQEFQHWGTLRKEQCAGRILDVIDGHPAC